METLFRDLRHGLALLSREKLFSAAAILTLGVAIGANIAIFGVVDSVLLEPLPYENADRLATVYNSYPGAGVPRASSGVPDHLERRSDVEAFEDAALYRFDSLSLGSETGRPERVLALGVTTPFFPLLGEDASIGRVFDEAEGEPGSEHVVVLSHALWQQLYAGAEDAVGRDLRLDGVPYEIVGVMPESFTFLDPEVRLWRPLAFTPEEKSDESRHSNNWNEIARLAPGATFEQAQEQLDAITARNLERFPNLRQILLDAGFHTEVHPLHEDLVRDVESTLYLLWGGVGFVLLIACVNLANLVLVRSKAREKELVTRFALGATRTTVTRQLLVESLVLTLVGGLVGLGLGYAGVGAISAFAADQLPRGAEIELDATATALSFGLALLVGLVLGTIPASRLGRADLQGVLREESRGGTESRGSRLLGRALVAAQVAFAFVLLIGAGLLLVSFREILAVDPGYSVEGVATARVSLPESRYPDGDAIVGFVDRALEELGGLPGVELAAVTNSLPLGPGYSDSVIFPEGYQPRPGESVVSPTRVSASPGYFETLGIRLLRGRDFDSRDSAPREGENGDEAETGAARNNAPRVAIVDESLARFFWGEKDPLGQRMFFPQNMEELTDPGPDPDWITVIGVVEDIRLRDLTERDDRVGTYYFPIGQEPRRGLGFAVRTPEAMASSTLASIQRVFAELDPELPVYDARPMTERLSHSLRARRSPMLLAVGFGAVALFLASIGLYGVLAYVVARRRRELGVRLALGSSASGVFRLVIGEGLWIVAAGLALGVGGAIALRHALSTQLYGVGALDPTVFTAVAALLFVVAIMASALPAWRAARIDPVVALHE